MEELNQKIVSNINNTLADNMSRVEQFINWEVVFELASNDEEYFKACKAIVEPVFSDDETSNEFNFMIENNMDLWEQYVRNSAEGLVHKDNWIKLIDLFKREGY